MVKNTPRGYGTGSPLLDVFPAPLIWKRAPTSADVGYRDGQVIVNTTANTVYMLTSVSGGTANWVPLTNSGGGFSFTTVTANTQMVPNQGYIANKSGTICTLTLPVTANVGDAVCVLGLSSELWLIAQNAGQTIHINGASTTTGATGSLSSIDQYSGVELVCVIANTDWEVIGPSGILTVT